MTTILSLAEPTMVIFSSSIVTLSALIKYTSVSDTAWPSGTATTQKNKTGIDCINIFISDLFGNISPTPFPSTVAAGVDSHCRRFFW